MKPLESVLGVDKRSDVCGGKDLWQRCVLRREWKREEVMDGENMVN